LPMPLTVVKTSKNSRVAGREEPDEPRHEAARAVPTPSR
jgi:hypothetical protein